MTNMLGAAHEQIQDAENIEEVICLAVLIAENEMDDRSTVVDARLYWKDLDIGCESCAFCNKCLACQMNA